MNQALSSYQKNQISGMNQKDLIIMLYSGAVKFITTAKQHLNEKAIDKYSDAIERAHRIIYHLYSTLDFDRGGEIAEKLGALYTFLIGQLYLVNSTKKESILDDLLIILNDLKEGWQGIEVDASVNQGPQMATLAPGPQTVVSTKV